MNIIVLSLQRAKERRERIQSQLQNLGLDAIILDAVDGQTLSEKEINKNIYNPGGWRDGDKFKPGEIGCILSTVNAIKIAKERGWEQTIFMDDDIILSEDFEKGVKFLMRIVPSNWQHIYLGGHIYMQPPPVFQPSVIPTNFKVSGSYCYVLKNSAYDPILSELLLMNLPVDDAIEKVYAKDQKIKSYIFFPFLAYPNMEYSYIWDVEQKNKKHPSYSYFKNKL